MPINFKAVVLSSVLSFLIYSVSIFSPVLGGFISFFSPAPIGYLRLKYGKNESFLAIICSLIFVVAITGYSGVFLYLFQYIVPLLLFCELYLNGISLFNSVVYSCIILLFLFYFGLLLYFKFDFLKINSVIYGYLNKSIEAGLKSYFLKLSKAEVLEIKSRLITLIHFLIKILPAVIFIFQSAVMIGNFFILKRLIPAYREIDLTKWKNPFFVVGIFILTGFYVFLFKKSIIWYICLNLLIVSCFLFMIQGLCIIEFWFNRYNVTPITRGLFLFSLFVFQFLFFIIALIGLFDYWFDFRKLNKEESK